jgi:glutathione S-transferase
LQQRVDSNQLIVTESIHMLVVHHLNFSRSTRILWLLEELGLAYQIVRHERDVKFKAPPSLGAIHPLGKAPVIVDGELVLAESAVILTYINAKYGSGRFAPPVDSEAFFRHEEWLHYAESTAAFPIMTMRIGALTGGLSSAMEGFVTPTLRKTLDHISHPLRTGDYLMGGQFTLADIQMAYLLEIASQSGLLGDHPLLPNYLERLKSRPAFLKAAAAGGPMLP